MEHKFTVSLDDREYTVERGALGDAAARGGGAPVGADRWYVTLGPKAIGSVEAVPGEDATAVERRIRAWLAEQPELPKSPDIILGGG